MLLKIGVLTNYPIWLFIFCILLGVIYALILYFYKVNDLSLRIKAFLFSLRALLVATIAFFLLSPLLKISSRKVEKPILIFLQDNSKSIVSLKDSLFYRNDYLKIIKEFNLNVSEKFNVKSFSFGGAVNDKNDFDFNESETDISEAIKDVHQKFSGDNIGALIIASDGIYNVGSNPVYVEENSPFPFYCIALGDTIVKKDIQIKQVLYNEKAYIGNFFPLEVVVNASKCNGLKTKLEVLIDNQIYFTKPINISSNNYYLSFPVSLEAKKTGIIKIDLKITPLQGEENILNNQKSIFIEIAEKKTKILAIANAPHPDLSALKQVVNDNLNYEFDISYVDNFNKSLNDYQLIILHQIPSIQNSATKIFSELNKFNLNSIFILGHQTNVMAINTLDLGLNISKFKNSFVESNSSLNQNFSLFSIDSKFKAAINYLPPLHSVYGNYNLPLNSEVLFYQKIGNVTTQYPLIFFAQVKDRKNCFITGEGIWRWKFALYEKTKDETIFNEFLQKIIVYLTAYEKKKMFKVFYQNVYSESSDIEFNAELYNKSLELVNTPEVSLDVFDSEQKKYPFNFAKNDKNYVLNVGKLPSGEYTFIAKTTLGNDQYKDQGKFNVTKNYLETSNLVADHDLLLNLSKKHSGSMFSIKNIKNLQDTLLQHPNIKSVIHYHKNYQDLIQMKWIFFFLLFLISTEWFIRKRLGKY